MLLDMNFLCPHHSSPEITSTPKMVAAVSYETESSTTLHNVISPEHHIVDTAITTPNLVCVKDRSQ
jgi:hypothetical protein